MKPTRFSKHLSSMSLNINSLNTPIKRYGLTGCIKNNIQLFTVYQKHIAWAKAHRDEK